MRRLVELTLVLLLLPAVSGLLAASDVIDGIAATVNSAPILKSDVEEAARYEALVDGRPPKATTGAAAAAVLERLIDQELVRQQMGKDFSSPAAAELTERMRGLRQQLPEANTDTGWQRALARHGLTEADVLEHLRAQLRIGRYIEQRLRPAIHIDSESVQAYYRDKLLPELKASGVTGEPALRLVRPRIQEILVQQRMDEAMTGWLRSLRQQSRIRLGADLGSLNSGLQAGPADEKTPRGGR